MWGWTVVVSRENEEIKEFSSLLFARLFHSSSSSSSPFLNVYDKNFITVEFDSLLRCVKTRVENNFYFISNESRCAVEVDSLLSCDSSNSGWTSASESLESEPVNIYETFFINYRHLGAAEQRVELCVWKILLPGNRWRSRTTVNGDDSDDKGRIMIEFRGVAIHILRLVELLLFIFLMLTHVSSLQTEDAYSRRPRAQSLIQWFLHNSKRNLSSFAHNNVSAPSLVCCVFALEFDFFSAWKNIFTTCRRRRRHQRAREKVKHICQMQLLSAL